MTLSSVAGATEPVARRRCLPRCYCTRTGFVGKMKALLCAAFAATASGFGSIPGELVRNPCANPDTYTPEAMLPGHCHGVETIGRDVCQTAGCDYSEDPQDAHDPCGCDTQGHCEGAGGVWMTPPCHTGGHAGLTTGGACNDVFDAQTGETRRGRLSWWATACCSDQVPLYCADDDVKVKSDSQGMVASCAAGLAEYGGCSQDMYTLGNAKLQELCAANPHDACAQGAPPGWFMQTCPTSCGAC